LALPKSVKNRSLQKEKRRREKGITNILQEIKKPGTSDHYRNAEYTIKALF